MLTWLFYSLHRIAFVRKERRSHEKRKSYLSLCAGLIYFPVFLALISLADHLGIRGNWTMFPLAILPVSTGFVIIAIVSRLQNGRPNQRPETNAGKESVSPTTPGPGVAHP